MVGLGAVWPGHQVIFTQQGVVCRACADLVGVPAAGMWGWRELPGEHRHDRWLWSWRCQRLHTRTGQVTVAVGTMTFEFPGLCLEFCLHNAATTWPPLPPSPFSLASLSPPPPFFFFKSQQIIAVCCSSFSCGRQSYPLFFLKCVCWDSSPGPWIA